MTKQLRQRILLQKTSNIKAMVSAEQILDIAHGGNFAEALPLALELEKEESSALSALTLGWILGRLGDSEKAIIWARLALIRSRPLEREYAEAIMLLMSTWSRAGQHGAALRMVPLLVALPASPKDRLRRATASADALRRFGMARDARTMLLEGWRGGADPLDNLEWRRAYLLAEIDILLEDYSDIFPSGHPNQKRFLNELRKTKQSGEPE